MRPLLVGPIIATFLCYFVLLMVRYSAICKNAVILIIRLTSYVALLYIGIFKYFLFLLVKFLTLSFGMFSLMNKEYQQHCGPGPTNRLLWPNLCSACAPLRY